MRSDMNKLHLFAAALVWATLASRSASAEESLSERTAVARAIADNPSLGLSVLETESAMASVDYEDGRYPWTFLGETGYTRSRTPALSAADDGVAVSGSHAVDLGASVTKHLIWGTDLTFRTFSGWQSFDDEEGAAGAGADGPAYS